MNPDEPEDEKPDEPRAETPSEPEQLFEPEPGAEQYDADVPLANNPPEDEPEPAFDPEPSPPIYEPPPESIYVAPRETEPPRAYEPPPRAHAPPPAYEPEPEPVYEPEPEPLYDAPVDADIPMPHRPSRGDRQRARDARVNLDLDLGRIKRRKRYGLFITTLSVIFIAFVLAPVTWVGAYFFFDPPSTLLMMQRAAEGETIRHYPVPINRMSPHIVRAVIAAEDSRFCTHDGFDVQAIQDAMQSNARGGRTRGASTVSQQTAKNLFLWPERSWVRKGFETYFTALIEFVWPKRRIMEAYLNAAEWGDGNFGVEAAARARFGVSAADLTPLQAARLAAVLPSPNRWRADTPGPYVRRRAASIVERTRVIRNERLAACVLYMDRPN